MIWQFCTVGFSCISMLYFISRSNFNWLWIVQQKSKFLSISTKMPVAYCVSLTFMCEVQCKNRFYQCTACPFAPGSVAAVSQFVADQYFEHISLWFLIFQIKSWNVGSVPGLNELSVVERVFLWQILNWNSFWSI